MTSRSSVSPWTLMTLMILMNRIIFFLHSYKEMNVFTWLVSLLFFESENDDKKNDDKKNDDDVAAMLEEAPETRVMLDAMDILERNDPNMKELGGWAAANVLIEEAGKLGIEDLAVEYVRRHIGASTGHREKR